MRLLRKVLGRPKSQNDDIFGKYNEQRTEISSAGAVGAGQYTDSVEEIKRLKREGQNVEAIELLLKCVDATEMVAKSAKSEPRVLDERFSFLEKGRSGNSWGVAPWYYEQLAILYRKERQYQQEVSILERYQTQAKAPGAGPEKLSVRLDKARELARKHA